MENGGNVFSHLLTTEAELTTSKEMPDNLLEGFGVSRAFSSAVHLEVGYNKKLQNTADFAM